MLKDPRVRVYRQPNQKLPRALTHAHAYARGEFITSSDVDVTAFAFYVYGGCADKEQTRVTIPMTIQSTVGNTANRVSVSLQTTVVSRDLSVDFSQ